MRNKPSGSGASWPCLYKPKDANEIARTTVCHEDNTSCTLSAPSTISPNFCSNVSNCCVNDSVYRLISFKLANSARFSSICWWILDIGGNIAIVNKQAKMARPSASSVLLVQIAREKRKSLLHDSDDSGGDDGVHHEELVLQNRSLAKSNEIMHSKLGEMERRMGDLIEENMQLRHRNGEGSWRANVDARLLDLETQLSAKVDEMFLILHAFRASRPGRSRSVPPMPSQPSHPARQAPKGVLQPAMARVTASEGFEGSKSTKSPKEAMKSSKEGIEGSDILKESSSSTKSWKEGSESSKDGSSSSKEGSNNLKGSIESSKESIESPKENSKESSGSAKIPRPDSHRLPAAKVACRGVRKNVAPKENVVPLSKANVVKQNDAALDKENVAPPAKKNSTAKRHTAIVPETPRRVRARKPVDYVGPSLRKKMRRESVRLVDAVTDEYFGREHSQTAGREPLGAKDTNKA